MSTAIDLSQLPRPHSLDPLNYDTILDELKTSLSKLAPDLTPRLNLQSEPLIKLLQVCAYRELLLRQTINDQSQAVMMAFAKGADLDHLSALLGVKRQQDETDEALRKRTQLSPESYSTAGPQGAYQYHAYSVDSSIIDVSVQTPSFTRLPVEMINTSSLTDSALLLTVTDAVGLDQPLPGDVAITVLCNHLVDDQEQVTIVDQVQAYLNQDHIRPLTDRPRVRLAELKPYRIQAELTLTSGPEGELAMKQARHALTQYTEKQTKLGATVHLSAIYAALDQPGVANINLLEPQVTIECQGHQAPHCTDIHLFI